MYSSSRPPQQLAYAPTPYSYTPSGALQATVSLDEEVKLAASTSERDLLDSLAEIYSIIVTLDGLEKAFNKDSVPDGEYTELCARLLKQYKSNLSDERVAREFGDLESFKAKWNIECPRASERLKVGLPATTAHAGGSAPTPQSAGGNGYNGPSSGGGGGSTSGPPGASVQSTILATENFITFLDALRLGMGSKDQLHPLLSEVIQSVTKVTDADFEGRASIIKWLIRLNAMRAHEELDSSERRELQFEMDDAYRGFKAAIGGS